MKAKWIVVLTLICSGLFAQTGQPEDVFLEADPAADQVPTQDLPPNEPPYTKTPDEIEAQKLLEKESPAPAQTESRKQEVMVEPTPLSENGNKKIAHPDAKKGLYLIDQNTGRYYYKTTKLSQKNQSTSIRMGTISPPDISSEYGGKVHSFGNIYGEDNLPYLILDYEWFPFRSFGKLGIVLGMGFFTASGNGRFANSTVEGQAPAKENFTFIGLPISIGGTYRLEFSDRQWLAPFVDGGLSYYALAELRDDGKQPVVVGTPAAYAGAGILFNITAWSKEIDFTLDREYGINGMWLSAEYRYIKGLNEDLDVTSDVINVGISVDY